MKRLALLISLLCALCSRTRAQSPLEGSPEFSLSIGYANVSVGNSSSILHSQDALKFDPVLSFSPFQSLQQLRLGFSGSFALVLDNSERSFTFHNGATTISGTSDIPFALFEPEARISWRQTFGDSHEFFIEPGVGLGAAIGWLSVDSNSSSDNNLSESATTSEFRAFLYAGAQVTGGTAGLEISWMQGGHMNFADNASGDVSEYYIGVFGAIQF